MQLKDFVAETLVQIQEGVQDAITRRKNTDQSAGAINPVWKSLHPELCQKVEFDVAITVQRKRQATGRDLKILSVELGAGGAASRIKFSVPIIPPATVVVDRGGK